MQSVKSVILNRMNKLIFASKFDEYIMPIRTKKPINKILIIQTAFPGDIILTTPLIQATRIQFPTSKIDFLTIPICQNLIESHPALNQVIVFDKRGQHRGWRRLWQLAKQLKKENYNLALIPHRSLRSAVLAFWALIPIRIGFHTSAAAFLFTHVIHYHAKKHEIDRNLQLLENFNPEIRTLKPEIFVTLEDKKIIDKFWNENHLPDQNMNFAIAPGSVWETKRWPEEKFIELCQILFQQYSPNIFLLGGKNDWELCERIRHEMGGKILNTAGLFTFRQSAEFISRCHFLICNDSAPLHIGVAMNIPVIAIFGPTIPAFGFAPRGEMHQVIEKDIYCRPCSIHGGRKCPTGTFLCMKSINPNDIVHAIARNKPQISQLAQIKQ